MNFRELPGFPSLFVDYVEGAVAARSLFSRPPDLMLASAHKEIQQTTSRRVELNRLVSEQAHERRSGSLVLENVRRLSSYGAVAVLATIPVAVIGGPLRILLKCLTAARVAAELSSRGMAAVPVCWVDDNACRPEDAESIRLLDSESQLHQLSLKQAPAGSAGTRIEWLLSQVEGMAQGQHSAAAVQFFRRNYAGPTFASSSCRLISALTEEWGLVVVDAQDARLESFVTRELGWLAGDRSIADRVRNQEEKAQQAGYAPPRQPGKGSHNFRALFLPIVQSSLLPVAVQVSDPEEFYCRALAEPLFDHLDLPPPIVRHRSSATLLDSRSRKFLEKHGLDFADLFAGKEEIGCRTSDERARQTALERFENLEKGIQERLSELAALVPAKDNLEEAVKSSRAKMLYQVSKLKERYQAARRLRSEVEARQLERVSNTLAPEGRLQENTLGALHFLLRYSTAFVGILYQNLDISKLEHQIISVD